MIFNIIKIAAVVIGVLLLTAAGFLGYAAYRIHTVKDTNDLQDKVDEKCAQYLSDGKGVGLYVVIVQGDKVYSKGYGVTDKESNVPPDNNTVFEIGSISKVFTAEMAQLLVEEGKMNWSDNILKYIPKNAIPPKDDSTTLLNLVTHTSGYPRLPKSWVSKLSTNMCDPYSSLTINDVYDAVRRAEDKKAPDLNKSAYSNLGAGLLGHIMEWKTGKTYEQLLQQYIAGPLQMHNTTTLVNDNNTQYATGYDEKGNKTCHWTLPVLQGAGAIKSNGQDMLRFLRANMGDGSALSKSFAVTHQHVDASEDGSVALGWHIDYLSGVLYKIGPIVWHNGGTGGFRSYMGFIPGSNTGVVVLSNCSHRDFDKLAVGILCQAGSVSMK